MHRHKWRRRFAWLLGVIVGLFVVGVVFGALGGGSTSGGGHVAQPVASHTSATPTPTPAYDGPDYTGSHLKVTEKDFGYGVTSYAGHIRVTNHTDQLADVTITVNVFRHNQNLGELDGYTTVKPHSSTRVKLTSMDDYHANWTDTHVSVTGFPDN